MTKMPAWRRYVTFWRANVAADVEDELTFHTDMRVQELRTFSTDCAPTCDTRCAPSRARQDGP